MIFDIRGYLDRLTPAKGKNRYICPACEGNNLTIEPNTGEYQCWSGCPCQEIRDIIAPLPEKPPRPKQERTWDYYDRDGNPLIQVVRKDDGQGKKKIFQKYWYNGGWRTGDVPPNIKDASKLAVMPYRYSEAIKHDRIFWVEGEPCADALWLLGIPATTSIGGSTGVDRYGDYSGRFEGKELVICPDMDIPGLKYAEAIAKLYPSAKWVYAYPSDPRWGRLPKEDGVDIGDWIAEGATKEDILGVIGDRRITQGKADRNQKIVPIRDSAINTSDLPDRIRNLLDQNLEAAELAAAKIHLRQQSLATEREFERLWETIEDSLDQATDPTTAEIDLLLSAQQSKLNLDRVLPSTIAQPLTQYANWQSIKPEVCLMSMLAVTGTLAENGTKAILQRSIDFEVTPNLYVAIEAEPSQKKSPILKAIARKPLSKLAKEAKIQHGFELQEWQRQKKEAQNNKEEFDLPEPALRVYHYSRATGEAILRQADRVPNHGLLCLTDELEGYFKSADQYRKGKGSDAEDLLTFYDGHGGGAVLRADGVQSDVQDFNFGMLGPIQPKVLQERLGKCEDSNGGWARWYIVRQPTVASTLPDEDEGFDIVGLLAGIYQKIDQLPAKEYRLDREAFKLFQGYYNRLEVQRVEEPNPALRAAYGKTAGRIGKLALNLHLIEAVVDGVMPTDLISAATIRRAAAIAKYAIDQIRAIYADFSGDEIAGSLAKVVELSRRKGEVKARDVQQAFTRSVRPDSATVRRWFIQLAEQNYGEVSGEGRSLSFIAYSERRIEPEPEPEPEPDRDFPDFDLVQPEAVASESLGTSEENRQAIDRFVVEYRKAANQNGHSVQELKRITDDLQRLPELKQPVWEALPIEIKKRVQVEVLGKPLNRRDREVS